MTNVARLKCTSTDCTPEHFLEFPSKSHWIICTLVGTTMKFLETDTEAHSDGGHTVALTLRENELRSAKAKGCGTYGGVAGHCEISQRSPQTPSSSHIFMSHFEPILFIVHASYLLDRFCSIVLCMNVSSFKPSLHAAAVRECAHENTRQEVPHLRWGFERSLWRSKTLRGETQVN